MAQFCDIGLWVMKWRSAWPIFHGPEILSCILKTIWCMNIKLWDYESVWLEVWPQNKWRSLWPIFHGPVILPYILKTIWCMNIILRDYGSVSPDIRPQNKCRSLWPIFHGSMILPYMLKTIWCMYIILWDYESVWPEVWPQNKCRPLWYILWFSDFALYLEDFDVWTSLFGIRIQYDTTFDLKINVGHCDVYFMVQWFCIISWRLFDVWTWYFGIMGQYDPTFDLKINVCLCDLYFMVQWFCPQTLTSNFDLKVNISQSAWPVFHGLVILLNIFKIIW